MNAKLRTEAIRAKVNYAYGNITREEAVKRIQPYINAINQRAEELAKEFPRTRVVVITGSIPPGHVTYVRKGKVTSTSDAQKFILP